jgi:hypothetical protein
MPGARDSGTNGGNLLLPLNFCCPGSCPKELDLSQPEAFHLIGKLQQQMIAR